MACQRQAVIWTNAEILLIGPLGTNVSEILIAIYTLWFKKMHLKMLSLPQCVNTEWFLVIMEHVMKISHSLGWGNVTESIDKTNTPLNSHILAWKKWLPLIVPHIVPSQGQLISFEYIHASLSLYVLTHDGIVMPYSFIKLCHYWLVQCQAITCTNVELLSIGPSGTNFKEIWINI